MRLLLRHSLRHWRALAVAFALATFQQLLILADPQILRVIVDRYVMRMNQLPRDVFVRGVVWLVAASVALLLLTSVLALRDLGRACVLPPARGHRRERAA